MNTFGYYLKGMADLILPRECIVCGRKLGIREDYLCIYCMADFPFTFYWQLSRNPMADALNKHIAMENPDYEPYSYAVALFFYHSEAGYKQIPQTLKYMDNYYAGEYFGRILGQKVSTASFLKDIDLIVPIPLHKARLRKRGYNQAEVIAQGIAAELSIPLCNNLLIRQKSTVTQTKLDIESKRENVKNAFEINPKAVRKVSPRHIVLVDDVFTTGSTMCACHRELRRAYGPKVRISALALGYVTPV